MRNAHADCLPCAYGQEAGNRHMARNACGSKRRLACSRHNQVENLASGVHADGPSKVSMRISSDLCLQSAQRLMVHIDCFGTSRQT
eukprot:2410941-Amphidinium_carterae.1